jgi:hypothetical protein
MGATNPSSSTRRPLVPCWAFGSATSGSSSPFFFVARCWKRFDGRWHGWCLKLFHSDRVCWPPQAPWAIRRANRCLGGGLRMLRGLSGCQDGLPLRGVPSFDRTKETCGPIHWRKKFDLFYRAEKTHSLLLLQKQEERKRKSKRRTEAYQEKRNFSFDASIYCSLMSRARGHCRTEELGHAALFRSAKRSCWGPCALDLTSEQRSPDHWQVPPKKHAKPGSNNGGNRICRPVAGALIYKPERAFRRPGNSGRRKLSKGASGSTFTSHLRPVEPLYAALYHLYRPVAQVGWPTFARAASEARSIQTCRASISLEANSGRRSA